MRKLPWWNRLYPPTRESELSAGEWQNIRLDKVDPATLERRIQTRPLSEQLIMEFIREHVTYMFETDQLSRARLRRSEIPYKVLVLIGSGATEEDQSQSIIHELVHGTYLAEGTTDHYLRVERLIDNTARYFIDAHTDFVNDIREIHLSLMRQPDEMCEKGEQLVLQYC